MTNQFKKGDKVKAFPKAYPNLVWDGEILKKTKYGYSVMYTNDAGLVFSSVFSEKRLVSA